MMDFLRTHADVLLLVSGIGFAASLVPTVYHQFQRRLSTVTLGTSVTTTVLLLPVTAISMAEGWWWAFGANVATTSLWALLVTQRVVYGHNDRRRLVLQRRATEFASPTHGQTEGGGQRLPPVYD